MKKTVISTIAILLLFVGNISAQGGWNTLPTGTSFILFDISFPPGQSETGYSAGMQYTYNAEELL